MIEDVFKCIEDALKLLVLKLIDWPLDMSIFISMAILLHSTCGLESKLKLNGKYVFIKSLLNTTTQNSGIRERSGWYISYCYVHKTLEWVK